MTEASQLDRPVPAWAKIGDTSDSVNQCGQFYLPGMGPTEPESINPIPADTTHLNSSKIEIIRQQANVDLAISGNDDATAASTEKPRTSLSTGRGKVQASLWGRCRR